MTSDWVTDAIFFDIGYILYGQAATRCKAFLRDLPAKLWPCSKNGSRLGEGLRENAECDLFCWRHDLNGERGRCIKVDFPLWEREEYALGLKCLVDCQAEFTRHRIGRARVGFIDPVKDTEDERVSLKS